MIDNEIKLKSNSIRLISRDVFNHLSKLHRAMVEVLIEEGRAKLVD
jgi:hypothetical protein